MSKASPSVRHLVLERWVGVPPGRIACTLHFVAVASTLAIAKVLLATVAFGLFLANEGPARLPIFYLLLAGLAILLSVCAASVVDRVPRIRLAQVAFAGALIAAAMLRLPLALDAPGAHFLLLASAHVYEIVVDIVFWVMVGAFVDSVELRRVTPLIYMGIAVGGAVGGGLAHVLAALLPSADLLWVLPIMAAVVVAQLEVAKRHLAELPDRDREREDQTGRLFDLAQLFALVGRYPLALLIALNALVLTILYGLSEYLVFVIYSGRFTDEHELTRFLAMVFAGLQVSEFALLYVVTRSLLQRTGPLFRNLVFPITSLLSLVGLLGSQRLPAAIVTHLNAEAISNAIFQPVNNANYIPLPLRFQGRARTLADGIFYPTGLALAGGMLLFMPEPGVTAQVGFVAIVFVLVFAALNVGVGMLFLPTLLHNLRSGVVHFSELAVGSEALPPSLAPHVRDWLVSVDPELRSAGVAIAKRLDPALVMEQMGVLAPDADRLTRHSLVGLLAQADPKKAAAVVNDLLERGDYGSQLIGLQAKLKLREPLAAAQVQRLFRSKDRRIEALGLLVSIEPGREVKPGTAPRLERLARDGPVASVLIEAIAHADRADLAAVVVFALATAPPEEQRRGLALLREIGAAASSAVTMAAQRLAKHKVPTVRAEAIAVLGEAPPAADRLELLLGALADPSPRVRRHAANALAMYGDGATAALASRLRDPDASGAAARALAQLGSRRARRLLVTFLQGLEREVEGSMHLARQLSRRPDRQDWSALEHALRDHCARVFDLLIATLAAQNPARAVDQLRIALGASDQRTRANAFEALMALPDRRLIMPSAGILQKILADEDAEGSPSAVATATTTTAILTAAGASADPWIRRAAAFTAAKVAPATAPAVPTTTLASRHQSFERVGDMATLPGERDMTRMVVLKRTSLFSYLPLDTILAVSRVLETRHYLAGEKIMTRGAAQDHLGILERGAVELINSDGSERLEAPACFAEAVLVGELPLFQRVVAIEDSTVLRLHRVVFQDLIQDHPEMGMELAKLLARRLRRLHETPRSG